LFQGKADMVTYWIIDQDLTPAKIRALNRRRNPSKIKSCNSSLQDLDLFRSEPRITSRRGSCRRSGSPYHNEPSPSQFRRCQNEAVRPTASLPLNSSALAFAINGQLARNFVWSARKNACDLFTFLNRAHLFQLS
jgi:hypothetical protein